MYKWKLNVKPESHTQKSICTMPLFVHILALVKFIYFFNSRILLMKHLKYKYLRQRSKKERCLKQGNSWDMGIKIYFALHTIKENFVAKDRECPHFNNFLPMLQLKMVTWDFLCYILLYWNIGSIGFVYIK